MKNFLNTALLSILLVSLAACGRSPLFNHEREGRAATTDIAAASEDCALRFDLPSETICAQYRWLAAPAVDENRLLLTFNADVSQRLVEVFADMPDMGHGTAPVKLSRTSATTVEVAELWLIMNGRWVIHVKLDGIERSFEVVL